MYCVHRIIKVDADCSVMSYAATAIHKLQNFSSEFFLNLSILNFGKVWLNLYFLNPDWCYCCKKKKNDRMLL